MKTGRELAVFANDVMALYESSRDFISDPQAFRFDHNETGRSEDSTDFVVNMGFGNFTRLNVSEVAHTQFGDKLGIPDKYYNFLRNEHPNLLVQNVRHLLDDRRKKVMIRTFPDRLRAILDPGFRRLENFDLIQAVMPTLTEHQAVVKSAEITERRMYMQAVLPKLEGEIRVGDTVQAGIVISNSEVGCGKLKVSPMIYRLVCLNGAVMGSAIEKVHIGGSAFFDGDSVEGHQFLTKETLALKDRAFFAELRDVVAGVMRPEVFQKYLEGCKNAANDSVPAVKIPEISEVVQQKIGLSEGEKEAFKGLFFQSGDYTRWGVVNAITGTANQADSYDRAVELEREGGKIIEMESVAKFLN